MSDAEAVITALRTGHDALAVVVQGLADDDLARPSGASDWDISQVLSHLGSGAEIAQAATQAALDGGAGLGRDFNEAVWERWNAMTRRQRADGFLRADASLLALYESMDQHTRESLRIDLGFLPEPVDLATAAGLRLREFALHSWDVRVAFDPHATLPSQAAAALLHGKPDLLGWIGKADRLHGERLVVRVTTSDPASTFTLHLREPVAVDLDPPAESDGTLTLPAEAWLRSLVAGRLAARHTPAAVVTTGAVDLDQLRSVFPGY